ncbi:MAG: alpha/beta hydrolase [Phycisphaerae bacterium]
MNPHTRTPFPAGRRLGILILPVFLMLAATSHAQTLMGGMTKAKPIDFSDRVVTFKTPDGVTIEADYYPVKVAARKKTPIAILIHMYPADRSSWKPFVPNLRKAGIAVLAYDIRGTGGSTKPADLKLETGYKNRDTAHFQQAFMDVAGATAWLGKQKNINMNRLVCIGASIGCSITLDYAMRTDEPKAVVCLSPGTNYFGVDSKEHIRNCSNIPILLISPEAEYSVVQELVEASGGKAKSKKYPGGRKYHGTGMFDADYGEKVKKKIMKFVKKHLGIKDKKKKDNSDKSKKKKKKKRKKKTGV